MAKNPMYSDYLEYAPTFKWGGREWGQNDMAAFIKRLGGPKKYDKWARRHRTAAKAFDPTEAEIYSEVQPVLTGIDAERKKRADYYQRLMHNLAGFTTALGPMLGAHAPAIGEAYREGAETMGAAGTGYGAVLNNSTAAAANAANQVLGTINAPAGQNIQGGDAGGVLAGLAGWIPETLLNTQGGAFAAAASELPRSAGIESQLMMKGIIDKAMEEEGDYDTQIMEVLQGLPGARQKIKAGRQADALKRQEFKLKQLDAERDWYIKQAYLAQAAGDDARSNEYLKLAQERADQSARESAGYDAYGNVAPGYHLDPRTGDIVKDGWKIGKNGVPVKVGDGKSGSTSSTVPGTPAYNDKALKEVGKSRSKIDKSIKAAVIPGSKIEGTKDTYPSWEEMYKTLYKAYDYLAVNKATKKKLDQVIRAALAAAGIKPTSGSHPGVSAHANPRNR